MTDRPSVAERARTMTSGGASAAVMMPDSTHVEVLAHTTDAAAHPLLLVGAYGPVARTLADWPDREMPAMLKVTDLAPVPLADRVRGRLWMSGWIGEVPEAAREGALRLLIGRRPVPASFAGAWRVLRVDVAEIDLADAWGPAEVDVDAYKQAHPDPLAADEANLMRHLDAVHRRELNLLCGRAEALSGARDPRAVGVDRYGLWVRVTMQGRQADVRFTFPEPVRDVSGLQLAYQWLLYDATAKPAITHP